jgi:hypothetical protein
MILKIERHTEERDWWIMDGIRRMSIHKPRPYRTEEQRDELERWDFDVKIIDNVKCSCVGNAECSSCPSSSYKDSYRVLPMELRLDDGNVALLLFDTAAYLLNDQGKTVERIVVNYPMHKNDGTKR